VHGVRHPAAQVSRDPFAVDDGCGHCPSCCGPAASLDTYGITRSQRFSPA
jgi:hypothetical protein